MAPALPDAGSGGISQPSSTLQGLRGHTGQGKPVTRGSEDIVYKSQEPGAGLHMLDTQGEFQVGAPETVLALSSV